MTATHLELGTAKAGYVLGVMDDVRGGPARGRLGPYAFRVPQ